MIITFGWDDKNLFTEDQFTDLYDGKIIGIQIITPNKKVIQEDFKVLFFKTYYDSCNGVLKEVMLEPINDIKYNKLNEYSLPQVSNYYAWEFVK